ncbi:uracil-DNA glycosylase family protein [Magnetovibrio sp.]|uniref:uracil-DNA glycosylase family protein n=1 Tax=Magnetovibrio sp. TaxID=2024836 RepID=UPI002F92E69E
MVDLESLIDEIKACRVCADHLPLGPRPVVHMAEDAKILIIGQAPGTKVHETGIPWNDASGDRLRAWMGVDRETFYDPHRFAIMPMGFCYPGRAANGGDCPPRPECAPLWHAQLRGALTQIRLTLLIGGYAQKFYLGPACAPTMTETVRRGLSFGADILPLPHPSWRNTAWVRKNPWFEAQIIPELRRRVIGLIT